MSNNIIMWCSSGCSFCGDTSAENFGNVSTTYPTCSECNSPLTAWKMTVKTHDVTRAMGSGKAWIQNLTSQSGWKENPEIINGWDNEEYVQNVECIKTGNYKGIVIERGIVVALVDRNAPVDLVTYLQGEGIAVILPPSMVGKDFVGIENAIARNQEFWAPDDTGRIVCRYCGARFYERDWNGWDCPACGCN